MAKIPKLEVLGSSGLRRSGGWLDEEFMPRLRGHLRAVKEYREMSDNCSVINGTFLKYTTLIKQADWRFEPASDKPEAIEWAEFMETVLEDMSHTWDEFLSDMVPTSFSQGYSYHEKVLKIRRGNSKDPRFNSKHNDGRIGVRKLPIRPPDTLLKWEFDEEDDGLRGMWQLDQWKQRGSQPVFIPIEKALLFRTRHHKGNPEGRSLLRGCVRDWHYLKRIQEVEAIGIERDLTGYPVMQLPWEYFAESEMTDDQKAFVRKAYDIIRKMRRDEREGAVVPAEVDREGNPTGFKLSLLSTGGRRQFVTNDVITRYETRILQSMLDELSMLGTDRKTGSHSLASSKTTTQAMALGSFMDDVASIINRFLVTDLMRLNGVDDELWPYLVHGDIETPPLDEIGNYLDKMTNAGITLNDEATERKLREIGNLPTEDVHAEPEPETAGEEPKPGVEAFPAGVGRGEAIEAREALNGAQVTALIGVLQAVAEGRLPRDSGIEIIVTAFPVAKEKAERLMGDIGRSFRLGPEAANG